MNTYSKNLLLYHQVIEPKLRYRALRLARGCEFTASELLAGAADLFASRHQDGSYTEAQLVRFGGLQLLQHCRQIGLLRRKEAKGQGPQLVALAEGDQLHPGRQWESHRDTRLALLDRALSHKSWVEPALVQAIDNIWEGATVREAAASLGLTASDLHKKLRLLGRLLGRQLLTGERSVRRRGNTGSQRRETAGQLDLFCVGV